MSRTADHQLSHLPPAAARLAPLGPERGFHIGRVGLAEVPGQHPEERTEQAILHG